MQQGIIEQPMPIAKDVASGISSTTSPFSVAGPLLQFSSAIVQCIPLITVDEGRRSRATPLQEEENKNICEPDATKTIPPANNRRREGGTTSIRKRSRSLCFSASFKKPIML